MSKEFLTWTNNSSKNLYLEYIHYITYVTYLYITYVL